MNHGCNISARGTPRLQLLHHSALLPCWQTARYRFQQAVADQLQGSLDTDMRRLAVILHLLHEARPSQQNLRLQTRRPSLPAVAEKPRRDALASFSCQFSESEATTASRMPEGPTRSPPQAWPLRVCGSASWLTMGEDPTDP